MRKDQKGFTLVELLVVVVILGILATLAVQTLGDRTTQAKKAKADANVRMINSAIEIFTIDNGVGPSKTTWSALMSDLTSAGASGKGPYLRSAIGSPGSANVSATIDGHTYTLDTTTGIVTVTP